MYEVNECSGYPRDNDEHAAGDVDGDQVVGELTLEYKLNLQAAVFPWSSNLVNNRCIYIVLLKLVSVYSVYILPSTTLTWILIKEKLLGVQKENSFNFRQTQKVIMPHISASHLWILKMEFWIEKGEYVQSPVSSLTQKPKCSPLPLSEILESFLTRVGNHITVGALILFQGEPDENHLIFIIAIL